MEPYTEDEVRNMLRNLVSRLGSIKNAANAIGVVPDYITQMIGGKRPGPAVLDYFGMRREGNIYFSNIGTVGK